MKLKLIKFQVIRTDETETCAECESFDEVTWTNSLRKQYQRTMKTKSDKKLIELLSNLYN